MRVYVKGWLLLCCCSLLLSLVPSASAAPQPKPRITQAHIKAALDRIPKYAPDRLLVRFKPGTAATIKAQIHNQAGAELHRTLPHTGVQVVKVPKNQIVQKLRAYRANPNVEFAEPDYNRLLVIPNEGTDPPPPTGTGVDFFPEQWGLHNTGQILIDPTFGIPILTGTPDADIDAPEAWDIHTGDASIKIAILDSGVDCASVDLAGKCVEQTSFVTDYSPTVNDIVAHGTHVAGIAAANTNNGKGTAGVGWNSSIGNLKACYEFQIDLLPPLGFYITVGVCPVSASAAAITHAADNGYHVINMSYQSDNIDPVTGEPLSLSSPPNAETAAVTYAWSQGVVIVAAAGNDSNTALVYPSAYSEVIAVAATDRFDNLASFSTFGNTWVSMMAPGENIISTEPDSSCILLVPGYVPGVDDCLTWKSGTSMASPHVAGAAALLWGQLYPGSNPATCTASNGMPCNTVVRDILESSADTSGALAQNFLSWSQNGRLNINNMLSDGDGDGILSPTDNCPDITNNDQTNTDGDSKGNACDTDDDNDGLSDDDEINIHGTDPLLEDSDGDGVNDGLEIEAGTDPLLDTSFPILYNGDVNNDGFVDTADLILAMRILLGQVIPTPLEIARLDVAPLAGGVPAPDGQITAGDYVVLGRKVLGIISF
jgi:subtilisin family serine protease